MKIKDTIAKHLMKINFVYSAIIEKSDLSSFKKKPDFKIISGIFLICFSYIIGWPLITLVGIFAIHIKEPLLIIIGGPLIYGFSHLLFWTGMYIAGVKYTIIFTKWAIRKFIEKLTTREEIDNMSLNRLIKIINSHKNLEKEFIHSGILFSDIFSLTKGFIDIFNQIDNNENICLCTEDKSIIISAILASMITGPSIIIPHSYSDLIINETHKSLNFKKIISDNNIKIPDGVDRISPKPNSDSMTDIESGKRSDSLFLKLFTGGSTGKPKVWSKTIKNVLDECFYLSDKFQFTDKDLIAATIPPQHIYGLLFSVLTPYLSSSKIMEKIYTFPSEIINALREYPITTFISVPVHYKILNGYNFDKNHLRIAFSSAGPLSKPDSISFFKKTDIKIVEIYGSTETGGIAYRCQANNEEHYTPFESVKCKLRNNRLYIQSDYLSNELQTDKDNFFLTYDSVETISGGFILKGRVDSIVKIGGKRVDLSNIQEKINNIIGVSNSVVISIPAKDGRDNEIVALIEGKITSNYLKIEMQKFLEPNAVPRKVKIIDKIPITRSGKFNRIEIKQIFEKK